LRGGARARGGRGGGGPGRAGARGWGSGLPGELLEAVAQGVVPEDRFRLVCRGWAEAGGSAEGGGGGGGGTPAWRRGERTCGYSPVPHLVR